MTTSAATVLLVRDNSMLRESIHNTIDSCTKAMKTVTKEMTARTKLFIPDSIIECYNALGADIVKGVKIIDKNLGDPKPVTLETPPPSPHVLTVPAPVLEMNTSLSSRPLSKDTFVGLIIKGVFDALATITADKRCVLYVWYDNEFGYTCQVVRILRQITHFQLPVFPIEE